MPLRRWQDNADSCNRPHYNKQDGLYIHMQDDAGHYTIVYASKANRGKMSRSIKLYWDGCLVATQYRWVEIIQSKENVDEEEAWEMFREAVRDQFLTLYDDNFK